MKTNLRIQRLQRTWWLASPRRNALKLRSLPPCPRSTGNGRSPSKSRRPRSCWTRFWSAFRERPYFKRVVLDAEGYRQRRVEAIQGMAHRTARRAVRERRTVEMPPMNSSERRVVHLFLSDNPGVTTESEGSGDNRRVKVSPSS